METVVLVIHLLIALALIGVVLLQRSEGGALGIGGGSGGGNLFSARGVGNALTRTTAWLAVAFFITSITLGVMATNRGSGSLLDRVLPEGVGKPAAPQQAPAEGSGGSVLPQLAPPTQPAQPASPQVPVNQ